MTGKLRWQRSDGEGSQERGVWNRAENQLKRLVGILRTSLWERKGYLLGLTSPVRIRDNQEQEEKQIQRPLPGLKVTQIRFHWGDKTLDKTGISKYQPLEFKFNA